MRLEDLRPALEGPDVEMRRRNRKRLNGKNPVRTIQNSSDGRGDDGHDFGFDPGLGGDIHQHLPGINHTLMRLPRCLKTSDSGAEARLDFGGPVGVVQSGQQTVQKNERLPEAFSHARPSVRRRGAGFRKIVLFAHGFAR